MTPVLRPLRDDEYDWAAALASLCQGETVAPELMRARDLVNESELNGRSERLVAEGPDGRPRATGRLRTGQYLPPRAAFVIVMTEPGWRGRGLGRALYTALEQRARDLGATRVQTSLHGDDPASRAFLDRRGFTVWRTRVMQELDLVATELPEVPVPEGARLVTVAEADSPALRRDLYDMMWVVERDIPAIEADTARPDFAAWERDYFNAGVRPPDLFWLALDAEGRVAGTVSYDGPMDPGGTASLGFTGVRPDWRRRGLARALKAHGHRVLRDRGMVRVVTGNDPDNPSVMALNRSLGYRVVREVRLLRKEL